jgi:hypothetical protein
MAIQYLYKYILLMVDGNRESWALGRLAPGGFAAAPQHPSTAQCHAPLSVPPHGGTQTARKVKFCHGVGHSTRSGVLFRLACRPRPCVTDGGSIERPLTPVQFAPWLVIKGSVQLCCCTVLSTLKVLYTSSCNSTQALWVGEQFLDYKPQYSRSDFTQQ